MLTQMASTSCESTKACIVEAIAIMVTPEFMVAHRVVLLVVAGGVPTLTLMLSICSCAVYCRKRRRRSQLDVAQAGTSRLYGKDKQRLANFRENFQVIVVSVSGLMVVCCALLYFTHGL